MEAISNMTQKIKNIVNPTQNVTNTTSNMYYAMPEMPDMTMVYNNNTSNVMNTMNNNMNCNSCQTKEEMLQDIQCCKFAITDMALYLDTHPEDQRALCLHREYCNQCRCLTDQYQRMFGPLTIECPCNQWRWLEEPWGGFTLEPQGRGKWCNPFLHHLPRPCGSLFTILF